MWAYLGERRNDSTQRGEGLVDHGRLLQSDASGAGRVTALTAREVHQVYLTRALTQPEHTKKQKKQKHVAMATAVATREQVGSQLTTAASTTPTIGKEQGHPADKPATTPPTTTHATRTFSSRPWSA